MGLRNPAYDRTRGRCAATGTGVLIVIGVLAAFVMLLPSLGQWHDRLLAKLSLLLSGLLPPVWFWAEYLFIWRPAPYGKRPAFEHLKYGQELGRNVWLAFTAILLAIYFK
jgi:hypothetical protein